MDLGPIHWLLGVEVKWDHVAQTINRSQKAYIIPIVIHFHLKDTLSMSTPTEAGVQLVKTEKDMSIDPHVLYKEIIRSLMYAAMATQPDITFAVSALAQFMRTQPGHTGRPQNVSSDTSMGSGIWNLPMELPTLESLDTLMPTMPLNTTDIPY